MAHVPVQQPTGHLVHKRTCNKIFEMLSKAYKHRKMAHCASTQAVPRMPKCSRHLSRATSIRWWAALACVLATPLLLRHAPSSHPVGEARVAVVGWGSGADWRAAVALTGAALAVDPAAPRLLAHRPARLPIGEAISTVVWVSRRRRRWWHCRELRRAWQKGSSCVPMRETCRLAR